MERRQNRIYKALVFYWIVLVVWQNISTTVTRTGLDLVIKVILILWITFEFLRVKHTVGKKCIPFVLFALFMVLAYCLNERTNELSVIINYAYPLLFVFLTYVVGDRFTINRRELLQICNGVILVVAYMALYAIIFDNDQIVSALSIQSAYGNELRSFFVSSHEYGLYLAGGIVSCLIALRIKARERIQEKYYYWIAMFLFFPNLILTFSRTSLLGLICVVAVLLVFSKRNNIKKYLIVCVLLLALLLVCNPSLRNYAYTVVLKENKLGGRGDLYRLAISYYSGGTVMEKIFGHGVETTRAYFEIMTTHGSVHNAYLQMLLFFGLIGFTIMMAFLVIQVAGVFKIFRKDRFCGSMMLAVLVMGLAIMFTDTTYIFFPSTDSYFLTIIAIVFPKYIRNAIQSDSFM
ncbi:MAG: O-antigen ligase family protein [Clostridia bacterium]|nr:O-antigen ligase family protein [Clostridia bacterium]